MRESHILLTGANGMVGRNLLEHPGIADYQVLKPSSKELDLRNFPLVYEYLLEHKPAIIIHAAGKVGGIQANLDEPVRFLLDNLDMGRNLIWAARQAGVKHLLNIGSSCMYPRNHDEPLNEELILTGELEPTNEGYALAKIVIERLCEYISKEDSSYKYKTIIPCNLYGPYDKFDASKSHLIPAVIHKIHMAIKNGDNKIEIWGDGTARREFMYAGDLADMLIRALNDFDSLPAVMNVGLGYDYSINEYYSYAAEVMGYEGDFEYNLQKPVGMKRKVVDIGKQQRWGWMPKTDLKTGLGNTFRYYIKGYEV